MSDLSDANLRFLSDRLARLADVVEPDASKLEAPGKSVKRKPDPEPDSISRPLPAAKLALGLVVVLCGIGAMVFFAGDGGTPVEEGPRAEEVADVRTPDEEEPDLLPVRSETPETARPTAENRPVRPTAVKPGVAMLLPSLLTKPSQIRLERVWTALEENPRQASAILLRLPDVEDDELRIALLLALAGANGESDVREKLLAELQGSGSPAVRGAAAAALGHAPGEDHLPVKAARGLSVKAGVIEDETLRAKLIASASTERDPGVLGTLIRLLGPSRGRDREIDERLFELARSPSAGLRQAAIDGLRAGREGDQRVLGRLIEDAEIPAEDRAKLVATYARHEDSSEALARLTGLIDRAEAVDIRVAAVAALRPLKTEEARRKARAVLEDTSNDRRIRIAALGVIADEGSEAGLKALREFAAGDDDGAVKAAAKELIRTLSPEKGAKVK